MSDRVTIVYGTPSPQLGLLPLALKRARASSIVVSAADLLDNASTFRGAPMIMLGSLSSMVAPFTPRVTKLITIVEAHLTDGPYLGICFGAQLLAHIAGGRTIKHPCGQREIGYHAISPTGDYFTSTLPASHYYSWHSDIIIDLPAQTISMSSSISPIQGLALNKKHLGFQFHPEIDARTLKKSALAFPDALHYPGAQSLLEQRQSHRCFCRSNLFSFSEFLADWLDITEEDEVMDKP